MTFEFDEIEAALRRSRRASNPIDRDALWAMVARDLPEQRQRELLAQIREDETAREEYAIASLMFAETTAAESLAAAESAQRVLARVAAQRRHEQRARRHWRQALAAAAVALVAATLTLQRASLRQPDLTWDTAIGQLNRERGVGDTEIHGFTFAVELRTTSPIHLAIFSVAATDPAAAAVRQFPPTAISYQQPGLADWPRNPLPFPSVVRIPPRGSSRTPGVAGTHAFIVSVAARDPLDDRALEALAGELSARFLEERGPGDGTLTLAVVERAVASLCSPRRAIEVRELIAQ